MRTKQVVHIDCKVYLLKSVHVSNLQRELTNFIDQTLVQEPELQGLHNNNQYKFYSFSGFKEIESDGLYKEGRNYTFSIRCLSEKMGTFFSNHLSEMTTSTMKGLVCNQKIIKRGHIEKLYTLTPAIMKFEDGYWRKSHTLADFEKRLFENAVKKFNAFYQIKLDENFVFCQYIRFLNRMPIKTKYKEISLLGDKFELRIDDNEKAQELAYFLLATGVCEANARSYGFVNYKMI